MRNFGDTQDLHVKMNLNIKYAKTKVTRSKLIVGQIKFRIIQGNRNEISKYIHKLKADV